MPSPACSSARRLLAGLLLAMAAGPAWAAGDEPVTFSTIELEMDPLDADVIFRKNKNDTSYFPVTLVEPDGQRLKGLIGTKGGFSQGFEKRPLSIKLLPPGKHKGQSRLVLNSMGVDRSAMREVLAWDLIHSLGMVAPPVGYTFVRVNGQDRGLFFQIGWIGSDLFEAYGLGGRGEMYDPVDAISCADLTLASVRDPPRCWDKIFPGDGNYDTLKKLVLDIHHEPIETFDRFAQETFHLESAINWIVVTAVTSNTQTYNDEYFLFLSEKTGKWLVIPWSYDRSFGWNYEFSVPEPAASDNENFQYFYPLELGALNALRGKLFNNPVTRKMIEDRLSEIVLGTGPKQPWTGWFSPGQMNRRIDRIEELRAPYLARDPFIGPEAANVREKVEALRDYAEARYHYFRIVTLGKTDWVRDTARASLPRGGGRVTLTDGWGIQLARLEVPPGSSGRIEVEVSRGRPELAPPGISRRACVRRTWKLKPSKSVAATLRLQYLDENQRLSELGRQVTDETRLTVFQRGPDGWEALPTTGNKLSNTLTTEVRLGSRRSEWFIACQAPSEQAPAP